MKIYLIDSGLDIDCLGYSPMQLLEKNLGDVTVVSKEEDIPDTEERVAVIYSDTPLVTKDFLLSLDAESTYAVGRGYIGRKNDRRFRLMRTESFCVKRKSDVSYILSELKRRLKEFYADRDVLFYDFDSCEVDFTAEIADGAVVYPYNRLKGYTKIGRNAVVFSFNDLVDTVVGEGVDIRSTFATSATIGDFTTVGPFTTLRKGAVIGSHCRVGDYVEIKNATLGDGTKCAHLAYVGDATVGERVNVGCGTVFANYNSKIKQHTDVDDDVFIGANTNLVAPVHVAKKCYIAAGSTVTGDLPEGVLCIARAHQVIKHGWTLK